MDKDIKNVVGACLLLSKEIHHVDLAGFKRFEPKVWIVYCFPDDCNWLE